MVTVYLFQVDSAKENRPFFEGMRDALPASVYFRGLDFGVGAWTPDGVKVDLELGTSPPRCTLTLIELEAAEPSALRSSRKYLHESSIDICSEFMRYLRRVVKECDSTADPREQRIAFLIEKLSQDVAVTVKTAAALRSSTTFLEESPLTDQASSERPRDSSHRYISHGSSESHASSAGRIARKHPIFRGVCRLDPDQSRAPRRCVLILDAIVRQVDHSSAIYRDWKIRAPLKRLLRQKGENLPLSISLF